MAHKPGRIERKGTPITIRYSPEGAGGIDAVAFADYLRDTIRALRLTAESVAGDADQSLGRVNYIVSRLNMQSPAEVELTPLARFASRRLVERSHHFHIKWISALEGGDVPSGVDFATLRAYRRLGEIAAKNNFRADVATNGHSATVTPDLKNRLDLELQKDQQSQGTIRGFIRSYHSAGRHFIRIYPRVGRSVACRFRRSVANTVRNLIDRFVQVDGVLRFRPGEFNPYFMEMRNIEWIDTENAPTFLDMDGAFADADLRGSAVDLVRAARDGW